MSARWSTDVLVQPVRSWPALVVEVVTVAVVVGEVAGKAVPGVNWGSASALAAVAGVLLRRRHPVPALVLAVPSLAWPALQVAPALAAMAFADRVRSGRVVAAVAAAVSVGVVAVLWYGGPTAAVVNFQAAVYVVSLLGGGAAFGRLLRLGRQQRERLAELRESRRREHELVERGARADERAMLAREMHDVVSHQVSLIAVQAGALRATGTDPGTVEAAERIRGLAVRTNDELRHVLGVLREDPPDTAVQPGLAQLADLWRAAGAPGRVELPDPAAAELVAAAVQRGVYRVVQESLTNVHRHARGARVDLRVVVDEPDVVRVDVVNDAPPASPGAAREVGGQLPGGAGLAGLRERTHLLGGTFAAGPTPGGGYRVRAVLPVDGGAAPRGA